MTCTITACGNIPMDQCTEVIVGGIRFVRPPEVPMKVKDLARALDVSAVYVYKMRQKGFQMPCGATVSEARRWLVRNPAPCSKK